MHSTINSAQLSRIVIKPSSAAYAEQMEDLGHASYGTSREMPDGAFVADMFRQHQEIFPEGQFIAVDTVTDDVVGLTVSMRIDIDSSPLSSAPWWEGIGYG